jgi:prefoldin subunit 5
VRKPEEIKAEYASVQSNLGRLVIQQAMTNAQIAGLQKRALELHAEANEVEKVKAAITAALEQEGAKVTPSEGSE